MKNKDHVIVRIHGGIGNQLWQYAFGRSLSIKLKKKLVLDTSFYNHPHIDFPKGDKFKFELKKFNLHPEVLFENNLYNYSYRFFKYFLRFLPSIFIKFFFNNKKNYKINNFIFEDKLYLKKKINLSKIKNNKSSYFIGYWQNKEYFNNYSKIIKQDLRPRIIKKNVKNFISKLNKRDIAIHIRGGDISEENNYSHPDKVYYYNIINFLNTKNNKLNFHIYTDDTKYAKFFLDNIKLKNYTIISSKYNFTDVEEFFIMQHYKNFIINRSTFSWWAGYLSKQNKTQIFAPKIWQTNFFLPKCLKLNNMKLF